MEDKRKPIENELNLPEGKLISFEGDDLELAEKSRKELVAWELNKGEKLIHIYSTKNAFLNNSFMQLEKEAIRKGYKVINKGLITPNVLNTVYDKRLNADTQKANKDDSVVVGYFEIILLYALMERVSDIHIEVRNNGCAIRMRRDGEMMEYIPPTGNRLTYTEAYNLGSVIYNVLANTKEVTFDPRECQQAAVNYTISDQELKLRYQSVPAYPDGFDIILRVLPVGRSEDFVPLQKLGYTEQQVKELDDISSRPFGSLIIAGVTGSGKSTTLKNLIMYVNVTTGYKLKIYSIEDPPEYTIARITQIPVVIPKGFDPQIHESPFAKPIKACMRGDPDIIMIGEVRDKITGDLTKKAIQSGHQVFTTVHATSALGIIDRFIDFGLTRSVLGSPDFLTGLVYQKLMPLVCPHCSSDLKKLINDPTEKEYATEEDKAIYHRISEIVGLKINNVQLRKRSKLGCEKCKYQGIQGRSVCAEVIKLDLNMIHLIETQETLKLMQYWRNLSDGDYLSENMKGKTCMEHAFQKVLTGLVCPYDLEGSFKPINEIKLGQIIINTNAPSNVTDKITNDIELLTGSSLDSITEDTSWSNL